jgi:ABC-type glycerol-3-phosphate transport system permease component
MIGTLLRAGLQASGLVALARGRVRTELRYLARQTVLGVVLLVLLLLAFGFGLAAFTVWLAFQIGTIPALAFTGLGFLVAAGVVVLVAKATHPKRRRTPTPRPIADTVKQAFTAPEAEAPAAGSSAASSVGSTAGAMLLVVLVGYLLARQLGGRKET